MAPPTFARVAQAGLVPREEFLQAASDPALIRDLAPKATNLEGFLFPAQYEFPRSVTAQEIVAAMVRRFRQVWDSIAGQPGGNPHGLTPLELVTLASLVERETGVADERGLIAGVFYNRLRKRYPLQCDPTVIYALELAGRYRGFWLLETDMGHADPTGFVPRWLARHAYRHFVVPYRQVRLSHYLLEGPPLAPQPAAYEAGGLVLEAVWLEPGALRPDRPRRLELVWRVEEALVPGLKVSVRVRTADGGRWWIADPWLDEGWLAAQPPRAGDRLYTRLAVAPPPVATAPPTALEFVVYRSTDRPASGEGWIAWTAEPFSLPLGPPSDLAGGAREAVAALPLAP